MFSEEVSSLDKEFKQPLSDVVELFSETRQLLASEEASVWTCTANDRGCPTSSVAGELLTMSSHDCLSLDPEEENRLGAFTVFSREEKEHGVSLRLGEEEDARRAASTRTTGEDVADADGGGGASAAVSGSSCSLSL